MAEFKEKIKEIREEILLLLVVAQIVGIAIAAYTTIRIAPLAHSIEVNAKAIEQLGSELEEHADTADVDYINKRLDRMEAKLDRLIER